MRDIAIQDPPGFGALSKAEQVRYLQALWDRIADSPGDIPSPETHLELVESRLRQYRNGPAKTAPAFEILDRLSKKST
jgi:putative addiction module component (TIGR02574 family)